MDRLWNPGDRLIHRFNADLGPGIVVSANGRVIEVAFPLTGTTLRLAANSDALAPLELGPGSRARIIATGEAVLIALRPDAATATLSDGRVVAVGDLWPLGPTQSLVERLAIGAVDRFDHCLNRLDALHLAAMREADGLGSFLGGRIRLFPHQLYVASRATATDGPVRWLLADEVGLGKTVEACLIANHLIRTGRAERTLVIAPDTLTVQWLGELWRKYHQVFVLLDEKRLEDVATDFGAGFNPFDVHRRVVLSLELLTAQPQLAKQAVAAGLDLLIVDEAHHLRRPLGHPGNPAWRVVAPLAAAAQHALLLTATPLEDDALGFFRLLQLLRPDEFPDDAALARHLDAPGPLPPCTSSTRRRDIGGLPPRVARPVAMPATPATDEGWRALAALEAAALEQKGGGAAENAAQRRLRGERLRRALESPAALGSLGGAEASALKPVVETATRLDPRTAWLAAQAKTWRKNGDRTLVFVAHRETLDEVKAVLERVGQVKVGVFHEDLTPARRDIEVAQFRLDSGPSILISTECGGEGRNFEFCTRLVLFDLPWSPTVVEQRIGRLDRIGRNRPVEIVYFRPPAGIGRAIARLYETIGLFREPLGGLDHELGQVEEAIARAALDTVPLPFPPGEELSEGRSDVVFEAAFGEAIAQTKRASSRAASAAYHELHREPYRPDMAEGILSRVPKGLDDLMQAATLGAAGALGFHVEQQRGGVAFSVEFGSQAIVDALPGVPGDANYLGTFDRAEAVEQEVLDYFSSGHPLVEGLLAELDDSPRGRVGLFDVRVAPEALAPAVRGAGLLAIYREGPGIVAVVVDETGTPRPEWVPLLLQRPLDARRVMTPTEWTAEPDWAERVRRVAARLGRATQPTLVIWFRLTALAPRPVPRPR